MLPLGPDEDISMWYALGANFVNFVPKLRRWAELLEVYLIAHKFHQLKMEQHQLWQAKHNEKKRTEQFLLIATLWPSTIISHRTHVRTGQQEQTKGNNCAENRVINFSMEIMQIHCPIWSSKYVLSASKSEVLVYSNFCVRVFTWAIKSFWFWLWTMIMRPADGQTPRSPHFSRTQIFAASFT